MSLVKIRKKTFYLLKYKFWSDKKNIPIHKFQTKNELNLFRGENFASILHSRKLYLNSVTNLFNSISL